MANVADLAPYVENRIEEPIGAPVFWEQNTEVYSAIVEAICELLLLVGRPTQTVNLQITILPNKVYQAMPTGMLCITNMYSQQGEVYKMTQYDMDFTQASWGSDWENDITDQQINQWWPIGFTMYGVHPAVSMPLTVGITGIALPTTEAWPFSGASSVPFEDSMFVALEQYAAGYCRLKEQGNEFYEGVRLYQAFLEIAKRYTQIQDRRDEMIFTQGLGLQQNINPNKKRG